MGELSDKSRETKIQPTYWDAHSFAQNLITEFEHAYQTGDNDTVRDRFYVLAAYFRRTLAILHSSLEHRRERPTEAALENLIVLQRALSTMRRLAPDFAQSTLALEVGVHHRVNRDLVHQILVDARGPLGLRSITRRFNELDLIADARPRAIREALDALIGTGHAVASLDRYSASRLPYIDSDVDHESLSILLGPSLAPRLAASGYEGLSHVLTHRDTFRDAFMAETGFSSHTATLAVAAAAVLSPPASALHPGGRYQHADLSSSAHPRPYQRLLHAVLRAKRYAAQVIEAPSGSGKTLIGMLCIEDWLRTLGPGQSILVLVPTISYQRQWLDELCIKAHGLQMPPSLVFAGTPGELETSRRNSVMPAIIVLTYTAIARSLGQEGTSAVEGLVQFLQKNTVKHVILDEVHKLVADPDSTEARCGLALRQQLNAGQLLSLVGFSATLTPFRRQLAATGLELSYVLQVAELICRGWVAPFAEFGAPFNYSERERELANLIAEYRTALVDYVRRIGAGQLRSWFRSIPLDQRVRLAASLGMYGGRKGSSNLLAARLRQWEAKETYGLNELLLVSVVQLANGWSDRDLLARAGAAELFSPFFRVFERLRVRAHKLMPAGYLADLLVIPHFGEAIGRASEPPWELARKEKFEGRSSVAASFVGTYLGLRTWSRQAGEGRVSVVRSIVAAERATRPVSGTIVFDRPAPLEFEGRQSTPTYRGVGGLFANLLADPSLMPMAALTSAIYLPDDPERRLHEELASWVFQRFVNEEQADSIFHLVMASSRVDRQKYAELRSAFQRLFGDFVSGLDSPEGTTLAAFESQLLRPLRDLIRRADLGATTRSVLNSLSLSHHHLRIFAKTIKGYANIASAFRAAERVEVTQGGGQKVSARIIRVPGGLRRQLLLDLTARILDATEIPVNLIIVSDWARTGWNVISPNVLIDATATRNATAWQQLRGRSMRPALSWSSTAERLLQHLMEIKENDSDPDSKLGAFMSGAPRDEKLLLEEVVGKQSESPGYVSISKDQAAVALMLQRNKVTHVYEMLKAYGSERQIKFTRSTQTWERIDAISSKHQREYSVRPRDGIFTRGTSHAPLVVRSDPRSDSPVAFESSLTEMLRSVDEKVVLGWLRASADPGQTSEI